MPFYTDRGHYEAIARLLLAGDIQARVVSNSIATCVQVTTIRQGTERNVLWTNVGPPTGPVVTTWGYSVVEPDGVLIVGYSTLDVQAFPEDVAICIATYDYDGAATVEPPVTPA